MLVQIVLYYVIEV